MRKILTLGFALALCTSALFADDTKKSDADKEKAMMEAWMKASTPGDAHKKLDNMVGTWDVTVKSWMAPGQPPMESTGTAVNQWVLGNRWMEEKFTGSFMGMPFQGIGYTGYDNIKKQYVGTWMDNMSTAVMVSSGKGGSGNTYEFTSTMDDMMTGKPATITEKVTFTDADHHTMEMWGPGPDGKVYKSMEITYSRKK
ncbi:MAG TPA: DUF1579 domain-containing protein [Thermoanaerobaculia bacterium]|nr:DUF1579 domain-containing protein [Thermoanaerobaculia bacterium]